MRNFIVNFVMLAVASSACSDGTVDDLSDSEAEAAPEQDAQGKADAPTFIGVYATSATTTLQDGDVPNLELRQGGSYVRRRCYHAGCALPVPETDDYDTYRSSSGKTYLRFYSFRNEWSAEHDDRTQVRVVADVYEIKKTTTTIKLRKAYSSRWLSLRKTTAAALCNGDQGSWEANYCSCPGETGWSSDGYVSFVAGLGGCTLIPGIDESECDETEGLYTDDDGTLVATYCLCEHGMYLANTGCEAL